jgi:hypothetical protein
MSKDTNTHAISRRALTRALSAARRAGFAIEPEPSTDLLSAVWESGSGITGHGFPDELRARPALPGRVLVVLALYHQPMAPGALTFAARRSLAYSRAERDMTLLAGVISEGIQRFTAPQSGRIVLALAATSHAGVVTWYSSFLQVAGVEVDDGNASH